MLSSVERAQDAFSLARNWARGSRAVPHATVCDAVHGAFVTLPPYTRKRRGQGAFGFAVEGATALTEFDLAPLSEASESIERECPATSAEGTALCASP